MSNQPILFRILANIFNFGANGKWFLSGNTVRDKVILGKYWTLWLLWTTPLGSPKNLEFSEFWLPS